MNQQVFGDNSFTASRQAQFLSLMLHHEEFFDYARTMPMLLSDFTLPTCQLVFEVLTNHYGQFSKSPTWHEFEDSVYRAVSSGQGVQTEVMPEEHEALCTVMAQLSRAPLWDIEYGKAQLYTYVKETRTKQVMAKYSEAVNRGVGSEEMLSEMAQVERLRPPMSRSRLSSLLGDADSALTLSATDVSKIPTGLGSLDVTLGGGLDAAIQELGIGVACTGIGKTNMLINFSLGAAMAGYNALLITLELSKREMMQRAMAMAAHINARKINELVEKWDDAEMQRFEMIQHSKLRDLITIADMRDRQYTMTDISHTVYEWKEMVKRRTGTDKNCRMVLIDWLDLLAPDLRESKTKTDGSEWQAMSRVTQEIRFMQAAHNVACWTVTQGNRQSSTAEALRMEHTATSFQKLWYVAVALGLSAPSIDKYVDENMTDDDLKKSGMLNCDRDLTLTIMKNRTGPKFGMKIYQGETLRFWPSRSMWQAVRPMLAENNMKKLFGNISE